MKYNKLTYNYNPDILSFDALFSKGINRLTEKNFKFNELGLRSVICNLASININGLDFSTYEELYGGFKFFSNKEYYFLSSSKRFFWHQLDEMDDVSQYLFSKLLVKEFNFSNFLIDDELNHFIYEVVLDETYLIRNIEYGKYCIHFSKKILLSKTNEIMLKRFINKVGEKKVVDFSIDYLLKNKNHGNLVIDRGMIKFITSTFQDRFAKGNRHSLFYYDFAQNFNSNAKQIILNVKELEQVVLKIIDNGLNLKQKKGLKF